MARRIANSRCRDVARASSRFATLTHAISRTRPTAPVSTSSAGFTGATIRSCIPTSSYFGGGGGPLPNGPGAGGRLARICGRRLVTSAAAASGVMPGFSRTSGEPPMRGKSVATNGIQNRVCVSGN